MTAELTTPKSAAEQLWRTIRIDVWPGAHTIRWAVYLRLSRGQDLVWQRNLGASGLEVTPERSVESTEGVLRTVAAALLETAEEMSRTPA